VEAAQAANIGKPLWIDIVGGAIEDASNVRQCFVQWQPNAWAFGKRFGHEEWLRQKRFHSLAAAIRHLLVVGQVIESTHRDHRPPLAIASKQAARALRQVKMHCFDLGGFEQRGS
jgi:hypothetical protein